MTGNINILSAYANFSWDGKITHNIRLGGGGVNGTHMGSNVDSDDSIGATTSLLSSYGDASSMGLS
jgi:hypothetical protein